MPSKQLESLIWLWVAGLLLGPSIARRTKSFSPPKRTLDGFRCAFFTGGSYPEGRLPKYAPFVLRSWAHAHRHADFYILLNKFDRSPYAPLLEGTTNLRFIVRPTLVADLVAFVRVPVTNVSRLDLHALSSLRPVFADFSSSILGLDLSNYSHFGYIELDVVLSDLDKWVRPEYLDSDLISPRGPPPTAIITPGRENLLFGAATLGGMKCPSLSAWTLLFANTASWRTAGAEQKTFGGTAPAKFS